MNFLQHLQKLSGIQINESAPGTRYIFADVDPQTGEYHEIGRGDLNQIIVNLESDPENSRLADVLKNMSLANGKTDDKGNMTFYHDNYMYLLLRV